MLDILKTEVVNGNIVINKEDFEEFMENLESTIETLEILANKNLMDSFNEGVKDIEKGKVKKFKDRTEIKQLLGI